jgi:phosphomannomutase
MFGEEYTLVAVADYILSNKVGNTVSNMSSTKALKEITHKRGGEHFPSAVGEVNVVKKMKEVNAVIGGEGNGGIIDPELHYGRDALIGIAYILMQMATSGKSLSQLRSTYPEYIMVKDKVTFDPSQSAQDKLDKVASYYHAASLDKRDGLKVDFEDSWVHLRKSNTEPILRIYAESRTEADAARLVNEIKELIGS